MSGPSLVRDGTHVFRYGYSQQKLDFRMKMYKLREERDMEPRVFANMVSTMLYEKRFGPFFVEPVVAGLEKDGKPFICAMDLIGAPVFAKDFVVGGTSGEELYGTCESLYRDNLVRSGAALVDTSAKVNRGICIQEPEDLFETISQALLAAVDRDCLAGWGAVVHIM